MPKLLVLVRHGRPEPGGAVADFDRQLTPEGLAALERSYPATFSRLEGAGAVELWSSPAARAWTTAQAVAEALGMDGEDVAIHDELYAQDARAFLEAFEGSDADAVIAVAHIPLVERLTYALTGEDVGFDAGAAAAIALDGRGAGELVWFEQGPEV